jgi:hypothetical protein
MKNNTEIGKLKMEIFGRQIFAFRFKLSAL